ncbi:MAG TPA: hypothetical protein VJ124_05705, partial [Pyrinomonadaceae bacterium]|nr:hypothetical protein [Pyrinomonadaceae bacterium]
VKGKPLLVATAVPPDVPRWLASRDQLLLALGLCPPSRTLFQLATEMGKGSPSVQLALRRTQAEGRSPSPFLAATARQATAAHQAAQP